MKIQKKSHKKRTTIILVIGILLIAGAAAATYYYVFAGKDTSVESVKSSSKKSKKSSQAKDKADNTTENTDDQEAIVDGNSSGNEAVHEQEKDPQPAYEGDDANSAPTLSGSVTYAGVAGSNLTIRTSIDQFVDAGTCALTLTNGSKKVTKSSSVAMNPSSSTCEGFDVPVSELGSGTWNISIDVKGNDGRSTTLSGKADV